MRGEPTDLVVVGAGLNGSLLALAAGEAGLGTALIDRVPLDTLVDPAFDGRTTALAYTSQRLFEALGMWPDIAEHAEPILDIRISDSGHDGRPSPLFLHFDHREAGTDGDAGKIERELGWKPSITFEVGLERTVDWYLENTSWLEHVTSGAYQHYYADQYAKR